MRHWQITSLLILFCLFFGGQAFASNSTGVVSGRIDCSALSTCRGIAVLWSADTQVVPDPRRYTIIPEVVSPLQADGVFKLQAPPGDYFVGAFLRVAPGPLLGPPRPGDLIFLTPDSAGRVLRVRVKPEQETDAGIHQGFWRFEGLSSAMETGIRGEIMDTAGSPVEGLLVFAFADRDLSSTPIAVSTRSDALGRFRLPLASGTTIYLRVRENYRGGRPEPGEYVGVFGGTIAKPLPMVEGQVIDGLRLTVRKMPEVLRKQDNLPTPKLRLE